MMQVENKQFKGLQGLTGLQEKISIYVPSTLEVNKVVSNKKYVEKVLIELSTLFGGATSQNASGSWYSNDLDCLVIEDITIVYSFSDNLDNEKIDTVLGLCEWLKMEMSQECISLEINGKLYFI